MSAPLPPNATSAAFRRVWRAALLPAVRAFRPEALFLSAGFDAHRAFEARYDPDLFLEMAEETT